MPSPEALSEADSGCASLVYELNSRVERLEKENLRLRSSIEEAEVLVDELQTSRRELEANLLQARERAAMEQDKLASTERAAQKLGHECSQLRRQMATLGKCKCMY